MPGQVLAGVAGHGLHPSSRSFLGKPLDRHTWRLVAKEIDRQLLAGIALAAVGSGVFAVTDEQHGELEQLALSGSERRERAARCLVDTVSALEEEAIETRVLQGAASAALDYESPSLRLYESVHLLVTPARLADAIAVLERKGLVRKAGHRSRPASRPGIYLFSASGIKVEVHRSLAVGTFGAPVVPTGLFLGQRCFSIGGKNLSALEDEARFVAACMHARLDSTPHHLLALRDVVQLVLSDNLSLAKVERLAATWRVEPVLADAVRRAWTIFDVPDVVPISVWTRSYRPSRRDLRRLAAYPSPEVTDFKGADEDVPAPSKPRPSGVSAQIGAPHDIGLQPT